MKKNYLADGLLLLATLIWGTSFSITKTVLNQGTSPITIMMYRALISSILVLPFFIKRIKKFKFHVLELKYGIIIGMYIYIGFVLQTVGMDYTTPSKNAFLTVIYVIFVPLILFLFYRQKINRLTIIAASMALIGGFLMSGLTTNWGFGDSLQTVGDVLSFLSAIFWAMQIIETGRYSKKVDTYILMFYQFVTMFILSLITGVVFKQSFVVNTISLLGIFYLAAFCTVISFGLMVYGMRYTSAEQASIIFTFEGVFGALFSMLFKIEPFSWIIVIGGLFIFLSLVISESSQYFHKKGELR